MAAQITLAELDLIKRIMGLTFSNQDGEALAAIRKANGILKKYNLTWQEILSRTVTVNHVEAAAPQPMRPPAGNGIDPAGEAITVAVQTKRAFDMLRGNLTGSFAAFIEDLEKQFLRTGYLSPDQRRPLFTAANRYMQKRKRDA